MNVLFSVALAVNVWMSTPWPPYACLYIVWKDELRVEISCACRSIYYWRHSPTLVHLKKNPHKAKIAWKQNLPLMNLHFFGGVGKFFSYHIQHIHNICQDTSSVGDISINLATCFVSFLFCKRMERTALQSMCCFSPIQQQLRLWPCKWWKGTTTGDGVMPFWKFFMLNEMEKKHSVMQSLLDFTCNIILFWPKCQHTVVMQRDWSCQILYIGLHFA